MPEISNLDNHIIAVVETDQAAHEASSELSGQGYGVRVLDSEADIDTLQPGGDSAGLLGKVKDAVSGLGDERRVIDGFEKAIREGKSVLAVEIDDDSAAEAARILQSHGGENMWRFGDWTFTRVGG